MTHKKKKNITATRAENFGKQMKWKGLSFPENIHVIKLCLKFKAWAKWDIWSKFVTDLWSQALEILI